MKRTLSRIKNNWIILLVNIILMLPLMDILIPFELNFSGDGSIVTYQMPQETIEFLKQSGKEATTLWLPVHSSGEWAIRLMVATLTCTPLTILFGWRTQRYRKLFGIYTFLYSFIHLAFFLADRGFIAIFDEFNFILGLLATVIIIPLGLTSNKWSMRLLKNKWKKIQNWSYAAALLAILHVVFLEGGAWQIYALLLSVGFILRIQPVKNYIKNLDNKKLKPKSALT